MSPLHTLFGFSGRINRGKYWLFAILWGVVWIVAILAPFLYIGSKYPDFSSLSGEETTRILVGQLAWLLLFIPLFIVSVWSGFALAAKRLHDRDKSGWWVLLFYFGPGILSGLQAQFDAPGAGLILGLGSLAISVWAFVELGCLRGTTGPNTYGPDPLAPMLGAPMPGRM